MEVEKEQLSRGIELTSKNQTGSPNPLIAEKPNEKPIRQIPMSTREKKRKELQKMLAELAAQETSTKEDET